MPFLNNNPPASANIAGIVKLSNSANSKQNEALTPYALQTAQASIDTALVGKPMIPTASTLVVLIPTGFSNIVYIPAGGTWACICEKSGVTTRAGMVAGGTRNDMSSVTSGADVILAWRIQ